MQALKAAPAPPPRQQQQDKCVRAGSARADACAILFAAPQ
jgi:hypothetical protein